MAAAPIMAGATVIQIINIAVAAPIMVEVMAAVPTTLAEFIAAAPTIVV